MTKGMYEFITAWQDKVFTKATPLSCAYHLEEEVRELIEELSSRGSTARLPSEIADCYLLLIAVCNKLGMTYEDICECINDKMSVNIHNRQWREPNEKGYVKHKITKNKDHEKET